MIKINLVKKAPKSESATGMDVDLDFGKMPDREVSTQAIVKLLIILIGPLGLWMYSDMILIPDKMELISAKQKNLDELTQKNNAAASAVAEMKSFEQDEARLKEQINVIENLRKDRMREVKVLDVVQREMPEHMWLTKVELNSGKIRLEGVAGNNMDRNQLIDSLNKSNLVKDVNLLKTNEELIDGNKVENFSIDCVFPVNEIQPPGKI